MILEIKKINKSFGKFEVLKSVSFGALKGQVVGLLGPNGAGKTTLMRVLGGFYLPDSGEVRWKEKKVDLRGRKHHQRIGYLPENNPLYPNLTVKEYLAVMAGLKSLRLIPKRVVEDCGLAEVMGKKIENLSKGFRQRVGLAATLLGEPELLILDEPTSGLDPRQVLEIRRLIRELAKDKVVILSTHILPEAKETCDRVVIINRGQIVLNEQTAKIRGLEKKFIELTI